MKVRAKDILLQNFGYHGSTQLKRLSSLHVPGMNGCFFGEASNGKTTLDNIVYQGGKPLGSLTDDSDAMRNNVGKTVIYWTGSSLKYQSGVATVNDMSLPTASNSWVQGGIGLYFGSSNWDALIEASMPAKSWEDLEPANYRTAMVAEPAAGNVYLFAWEYHKIQIYEIRQCIFEYFGVSEYTSSAYAGIMLDGGHSTQIGGYDESNKISVYSVNYARAVPQMITVKI